MAAEPIELTHAFPAYRFEAASVFGAPPVVNRVRDDQGGDYVHALHVQALAERVILAQLALKQGRTGQARELLDEACAYLSKPNHSR